MLPHLRELGYPILLYVNDFLFTMSPHVTCAIVSYFEAYSENIDSLLLRLGLTRHECKGDWGSGSQRLTHLRFVVDSLQMRFEITPLKSQRV